MTPLALEMLLCFSRGDVHVADDGQLAAIKELADAGLIENHTSAMPEHDGPMGVTADITGRGAVHVELLVNTPLPVQQWVDPRAGFARVMDSLKSARTYQEDEAIIAAARAPQIVELDPNRTNRLAPGLTLRIPDGFTLIPDIKPGELPPNLGRDHNVEILDASGKRKVMLAGSVNWQNKGKKDSPVAYRGMGEAEA